MADPTIIDELVTILTLDAEPYRKVEKQIEDETGRTFRKQRERARLTDRSDRDQQRRLKDMASGVKAFAVQAAAAVGVVTGLGVALVGTLGGFVNFQTSLRRQTVGTALSNREMQAWASTARRMGGDAQAGAEAIAALAKEREQFNLGVPAPTLAALSKLGINVGPDQKLEDIIGNAQRAFRNAPDGQKQQFENVLAAQGVSADLILMIKSDKDALETHAKSLSQATDENRAAADALSDAMETAKSASIKVAGTLLTALQPAIEQGAVKLSEWAAEFGQFIGRVAGAGGGLQNFQRELDAAYPKIGHLFRGFDLLGELLGNLGTVAGDQLSLFATALENLGSWIGFFLNKSRAPWGNKPLGDDLRDRARQIVGAKDGQTTTQRLVLALDSWWSGRVTAAETRESPQAQAPALAPDGTPWPRNIENEAQPAARAPDGTAWPRNIENDAPPPVAPDGTPWPRNIENDAPPPVARPAAMPASRARTDLPAYGVKTAPERLTPQLLMAELTAVHRLTVPQAAALVANFERESGLKTDAVNNEGGGSGARGLAQWRGARTRAFKERFGVLPNESSYKQQLDFALNDPYERALLAKSFKAGDGGAEQAGVAVSKYYEAHGKEPEDLRRGQRAARIAQQYGEPATQSMRPSASAASQGSTINIQNLTVQANNPQELTAGLQRLDATQPYNTVMR